MGQEKQKKIERLIEIAEDCIGTPYQYGAYLKEDSGSIVKPEGFDCSSFIQYCFSQVGIELPRSTILQAAANGQEIPMIEEFRKGDVIFFEGSRGHYRHDLFPGRKIYVGHAGIYAGNGHIIHATNNSLSSGVVVQSLEELANYGYDIVMVKRFIE